MDYSVKPSNSEAQSVFPLTRFSKKKTDYFEAMFFEKKQGKKNIHITR